METSQITLHNTVLENVFNYLYDQVRMISGKNIEYNKKVDYQDGTIRNVTYRHCIQTIQPPINNRILVNYTYIIEPEGKPAQGYTNFDPAIEFEGWQLQTTTVLIKAKFNLYYKPFVDDFWDDLIKTFEQAEKADKTATPQSALTYPGGLKNFIAFMSRLGFGSQKTWQANEGQKLGIYFRTYTDTEAYWNIETYTPMIDGKRGAPDGQATICAYEIVAGKTKIEFKDGVYVYRPFRGHALNNIESNPVSKDVNPILDSFNQLAFEIQRHMSEAGGIEAAQVGAVKPEKPEIPKSGSGIAVWFDYYHAMKKEKYKISFADLAKLSGYSANTFKQEHGRYKLERGID